MKNEHDTIRDQLFQTVCGLMYDHYGQLGKADWERIFTDAASNAFGERVEQADAA